MPKDEQTVDPGLLFELLEVLDTLVDEWVELGQGERLVLLDGLSRGVLRDLLAVLDRFLLESGEVPE